MVLTIEPLDKKFIFNVPDDEAVGGSTGSFSNLRQG
jgi:hypothetical protein